MATATLPPPTSPKMPALGLYRMPYEVYERIAERELIRPTDHVVLLDGLLVNLMPKGPQHSSAVARGQFALQAAAPAGWYVRAEQPVALRNGPHGDSAPEPDLAVVVGSIDRYDRRHPEVPEIGLLVEVAADSDALKVDRAGLFRYAFASIPIAWIVNVSDRSIEVYTDPSGPVPDAGYRAVATFRPGQSLAGEIGTPETGPAALAPIPVDAFFAPN